MTTPEDTPLYGKTDGLFVMSLPTYSHFGLLSLKPHLFLHLFLRYLFVFQGMVFLYSYSFPLDPLYVFGFAGLGFSLTNIARLFGRIAVHFILRTVPTNGKYFFPDNDYVRQVDHISGY